MTTREILNQEYYDTLPMKGLANSYEQIMKNRSIPLTYKADVIRTNVYPTVLHSAPMLGLLYHHNEQLFKKNITNPINTMLKRAVWYTGGHVNSGISFRTMYNAMNITPPEIYVKTQAFGWVCAMLSGKINPMLKKIVLPSARGKPYIRNITAVTVPRPKRYGLTQYAKEERAKQRKEAKKAQLPAQQLIQSFMAEVKEAMCLHEADVDGRGRIAVNLLQLLPRKVQTFLTNYSPKPRARRQHRQKILLPPSNQVRNTLIVTRWEELQELGIFGPSFDHLVPFNRRHVELYKHVLIGKNTPEVFDKGDNDVNYAINGGATTMKYIADVSRFTPHLTRGWETLRSLVMDGVKAWDLGEGRKVAL